MLVFAYFGLISLIVLGPPPQRWAWLAPLLIPLAGAAVQFTSTRVCYLRVFGMIGWLPVIGSFAFAAWRAFAFSLVGPARWLPALAIASLVVTLGMITVQTRLRSSSLTQMPCGIYGRPDPYTGIVRDLHWKDPTTTNAKGPGWILVAATVVGPLGIALIRQLVRSTPAPGQIILIGVGALYFAGFATWAGAWSLAHVVAIWRWERQHGKQIHVIR